MSRSFGPALISCLKQNGKFGFDDLRRIHSDGGRKQSFEFQSLARDLSIPWYQIYYAEHMAAKSGKGNLSLLRWLIVHLLHQTASGHLRTDLSLFDRDLAEWMVIDREFYPGTDEEFYDCIRDIEEIRVEIRNVYIDLIEANPALFGTVESNSPFIYFSGKKIVYIRKYYKMESGLLENLELLSGSCHLKDPVDVSSRLEKIINRFAGLGIPAMTEKTKDIAFKLLNNRFVILSGGPGTGKTTTVTALLRILKSLEMEGPQTPVGRIRLAAPTGRAANRMIESMRVELMKHPLEDIDQLIPEKAYTLHKLLGINPASRKVYYSKERPIPAELVILDEASMVDARLMSLLFNALAPGAALLLVGDRDQLPSVDAGAVFGDFVAGAETDRHKLSVNCVFLTRSWRSSSGILEAAGAVIRGEFEKTLEILKGEREDLDFDDLPSLESLVDIIIKTYGLSRIKKTGGSSADEKGELNELFTLFEKFAVLIPTRRGPRGVENINRIINQKIAGYDRSIYHGQPVMILSNDYNLSLFNGDRGIIIYRKGEYLAAFRNGPDNFRFIPAGKLGAYETSYCQTVHKSQGSEFERVLLLIPEGAERLLTREIVYTGITRARKHLTLMTTGELLRASLSRGVVRHSGIREYLGGIDG